MDVHMSPPSSTSLPLPGWSQSRDFELPASHSKFLLAINFTVPVFQCCCLSLAYLLLPSLGLHVSSLSLCLIAALQIDLSVPSF